MNAMEQTSPQTRLANLTRWFVPIAAVVAFALWFAIAPPGLLGKADAVGYAICHRIGERSFHIGDRQLPLCARCTGEFFSAAIGVKCQPFGLLSLLPIESIATLQGSLTFSCVFRCHIRRLDM